MCLDFLSCPMCRSHSTSFWISLREVGLCTAIYSVHLWEVGKSGASHIAILVMPSSPGICRFERIYRKSLVETWCVVDEEMGLEKWYDLLRVSETKNGSHSSDLSEGRTFLLCLYMTRRRSWTNYFWIYGRILLETRTLRAFPTEMTTFLELPSKNLDEMWNNLWRQFIRVIGRK